jgi:integrase
VPLSRLAIAALRRQRAAQAADRRRAGDLYASADVLFTDELGKRLPPMDATRAYARIAKSVGASSLRLHEARHTAATHLLVGGADVRSVSGILGHRNAATTLGTYAHLLADAQRDAVDLLGDRLERISKGQKPVAVYERQPDGNRRRLPYSKNTAK